MGSSGPGRISDYPGSSKTDESSGGPKGGGGSSPSDRCGRALSTPLEDIEHSDYYVAHGAPPPVGEQLQIRLRKRLVAETVNGEGVGNIPTAFNFLASCLKDGWAYPGRVTAATAGPPLASVTADFVPVHS